MANQVLNGITQKWNAFVHGGRKPVRFELAESTSVGETMGDFLKQFSQPIEAVVTGVINNNVCFAYIDLGYGGSVECFSACDHQNIIIAFDGKVHFVDVCR